MKYEKTQKGNPYNLVTNQHIFPVKSIERFVDSSGTVDVFNKNLSKRLRLKPEDKLFCARRVWDQKSELGYMKKIEDSFQILASKICDCKITTLGPSESQTVTEFIALWEFRFYRNLNPLNDSKLKGILPGKPWTKDEEERLEKSNIVFLRNDGTCATVPSRFMTGLNILMLIDERRAQFGNLKWGIVKSVEGEFVVPDSFRNTTIIPKSEVVRVNQTAVSVSTFYYFSRDLSSCPL